MKPLVALALCGALAIPAAAFAADPAPAAGAAPVAQSVSKKERKVCKTIEEKGSRLGGKRICRPQAEWDEMAAQQRQEMDRKMSQGPARQ